MIKSASWPLSPSAVFAFRTEALSVTYFEGAAGSSVSVACRLVSKTEERSRKKRAVLIGGFFIVFVLPANAETIIGLFAKKTKGSNPAFSRRATCRTNGACSAPGNLKQPLGGGVSPDRLSILGWHAKCLNTTPLTTK